MQTPRQLEDQVVQECVESFIRWLPEFDFHQLLQINRAVAIALEEYDDTK